RVASGKWVASQTVTFLQGRSEGFLGHFSTQAESLKPGPAGAAKPWFEALKKGVPERRLLLVVNESWGVPSHPHIQEQLLKPLETASVAFSRGGNLDFVGTTLGAELRELCSLQAQNYNLAGV